MKEIEEQLSENEFIVRYGEDNYSLVKLSKPSKNLTYRKSLETLLSKENELDKILDDLKAKKSNTLRKLIKDIILATVGGIAIFLASMKLSGLILPLTNAIEANYIIHFQLMISGSITVMCGLGAESVLKKYDKDIFKFIKKYKNIKQAESTLQEIRQGYDEILQERETLGYQDRVITAKEVVSLIEQSHKKQFKIYNPFEQSKYSYSFSKEKESYEELEYNISEERKNSRR